jgi:agmatinase
MRRITNFGDLPQEYASKQNAQIVVMPVPYDGTSTWIKGADKGPAAIIEASGNMELYDIETDSQVYQKGIFTDEPIDDCTKPDVLAVKVRKKVCSWLNDKKFVVVIGGEHSVSIGSAMAHCEHYEDISVLQLDAHSDLRDRYEGSKYNHACVMARIREMCPVVQVGIRSMDISEKPSIKSTHIFFAEKIFNKTDWIEKVIRKLSKNVYITIDLDVFDPSIMPSTGTPEPGGLMWYDVLALLKKVCKRRNVVGFDVVELCPNKDNKSSDFLAAKLIYKLLSYKFI